MADFGGGGEAFGRERGVEGGDGRSYYTCRGFLFCWIGVLDGLKREEGKGGGKGKRGRGEGIKESGKGGRRGKMGGLKEGESGE